MKKQINPTIKAYLIRSAFYLLLLLAVCAIPIALAQSRSRGTTKPDVVKPTVLSNLTSLSPTISATHRVRPNPDFAQPGMFPKQLSSLGTDGAVAPASGAVDASSTAVVKNLQAPLVPAGGCGTPGPWSTATPGPPARYRAGGCTDGQYVYVYGGGDSAGGNYNDLWRWNPGTQGGPAGWTQLANMPTAKQNIQGAYWNGKIYVPGGFVNATATHITENAIYDIATNTWSTGAPLPAPQTGANVAFNNKIYNFGGNPGPQSTVTIYDIATNTWSNGAAMPVPITYGRAAVSILPFAYYAGGIAGGVTVNTFYRYDFAANTWATMAPLQTARTSEELMTSPLGDQLYAVMGGDSTFFTGVPLPVSVEIYSLGANSWTYGNPVVTKAAAPSGGLAGTTAMVQGGVDGTTYYNTVQVSVVPCGTPVPTPTSTPTGTPGGCQFHVLIAYADSDGPPSQLQSEILAEPNVVACDLFDAASGTPTLAQLQQYQIVVPFSNSPFLDADTLGNNLADYVDGGGIVVQYGFSSYGPGQPYGVNGRWVSGNYNPYNYSTNLEFNAFTLGTHNAAHPLMAGVTTLNSNFANIVTLAAGATEVAQNSLGESLVAYRPVSGGHTTVAVTAYVGFTAAQSGDWGKVIVNAGNWLANCQGVTPTPTSTPTGTPSCSPGWQNEPAMANARRNPATVAVGSDLYAITGFNAAPDYTAVNERFNGSSWTTMAPITVPHAQSRGTAVGTNIYVPGGFNSVSFGGPLDTMQIYNTGTNTWSSGATMPAARSGVATATFNGLVYIIAGYNPVGTGHPEVYIYNPGTNSYTTGAPMPAGEGNVAGVLFNGEIYVVGGGTAPGAQFAYNPTTNAWRTIAVLPTTGGTCQSDGGFVLNNELWVVGCLGLPINQQVWIYNPGSNSWRAGPQYNVDHQGPGAALFNNRGFVVGGGAAGGGSTAVESVGGCGGQSPTPTATTTATATATSTPTSTSCPTVTSTPTTTATATVTPTAPATATPTAPASATPTATVGPRSTPTPRPRPTPAPRP